VTLPAYSQKFYEKVLSAVVGAFKQLELGVATITASATQTLAGATPITSAVTIIGTCSSSGNAIGLPTALAGQICVILNAGANPASVFPASASDTVDSGGAGAAATLTNGKRAIFFCTAAGAWTSSQLGVASA